MVGSVLGLILGSIAASAVGGIVSARSQAQANQSNLTEAQTNRDWQEYMSNTAHQREVVDLKQAGLNPWLSVSGSGAPVTSGSTAQQFPTGDYGLSNVASALQSLAFMQALSTRASSSYQGNKYLNILRVAR